MALCYCTCMRPSERVETTGNMVPKKWQQSSQKALTINRKEGKNGDEQQFISYAFWLFQKRKISLPLFPQFLAIIFGMFSCNGIICSRTVLRGRTMKNNNIILSLRYTCHNFQIDYHKNLCQTESNTFCPS